MQNNNYWNDSKNRAVKAKEWVDKMEKEHPSEIAHSVRYSLIYNKEDVNYPCLDANYSCLKRCHDTIVRYAIFSLYGFKCEFDSAKNSLRIEWESKY